MHEYLKILQNIASINKKCAKIVCSCALLWPNCGSLHHFLGYPSCFSGRKLLHSWQSCAPAPILYGPIIVTCEGPPVTRAVYLRVVEVRCGRRRVDVGTDQRRDEADGRWRRRLRGAAWLGRQPTATTFQTVRSYDWQHIHTYNQWPSMPRHSDGSTLPTLWHWPLTYDLKNLFTNVHPHDEYLCQVLLKFLHWVQELSSHAK